MDTEALTDPDFDQVLDYLRLHRALEPHELDTLLQSKTPSATRKQHLLDLITASPPSVQGLFINALRYAGNHALASKYDVDERIVSPESYLSSSTRRCKGQVILSLEVGAIKVSSAEYGISLGNGRRPSLLSLSSRDCWISVGDLNKSSTSLVITTPVSIKETQPPEKKKKKSCCFCCCFGRNKKTVYQTNNGSSLLETRPPPLECIVENVNVKANSDDLKTPKRFTQTRISQKHSTPIVTSATDGVLAKKALILSEKSKQFYEILHAQLCNDNEKLVRFLEQQCGLLFLDSNLDSYNGIQISLVATTLSILNSFLSKMENDSVEKQLNQLLVTDQTLKSLRVRKLVLQCQLNSTEAYEELLAHQNSRMTNRSQSITFSRNCSNMSTNQSIPAST